MPAHPHHLCRDLSCATCGDPDASLARYTSLTTGHLSTHRVCQSCYSRLRRWERALADPAVRLDGILGPAMCGACVRAVLAEAGVGPPRQQPVSPAENGVARDE